MNIAQIALMAARPHWMQGIYIIYINNYVTILGMVFATVWTSRHNWAMRLDSPPDSSMPPTTDARSDKSVDVSLNDTPPNGDRWFTT